MSVSTTRLPIRAFTYTASLRFPTTQTRLTISTMSLEKITTISPITNKPIITRNGLSDADIQSIPEKAVGAFESFRRTSLAERKEIVKKAMKLLDERQDALGKEITEQMGRPITYTPKEITTAVMRGEYLLKISDETLKDTDGEAEKGFKRYIKKVPIGPVLILFPWNVCARKIRLHR
jgi:acyl-CoA reductase-like NAD-dependent aldehyde dehydrogenase